MWTSRRIYSLRIPSLIALLLGLVLTQLSAAAAVADSAPDLAPDIALEVTHRSASAGTDGVKRTLEFTEHVVRRGNTVWIERVMPNHKDEHVDAQASARIEKMAQQHEHPDLSAATRWIEHDPNGKTSLKLVLAHDQMVVNIAPAEYGTVGFDGSWMIACHLIDPAVLSKLEAADKTSDGLWYVSSALQKNGRLRVLWNAQLQVPMQVEFTSGNGDTTRSTSVRILKETQSSPWLATKKYQVKDYTDFLD